MGYHGQRICNSHFHHLHHLLVAVGISSAAAQGQFIPHDGFHVNPVRGFAGRGQKGNPSAPLHPCDAIAKRQFCSGALNHLVRPYSAAYAVNPLSNVLRRIIKNHIRAHLLSPFQPVSPAAQYNPAAHCLCQKHGRHAHRTAAHDGREPSGPDSH